MKKFYIVFICFLVCVFAVGCDSATAVKSGHISEITGAKSTEYAIKVILDNDERVDDKYVDIQVRSENENQFIKINEENNDEFTICIDKKDYWYNLTYLIKQANGSTAKEKYQAYKDYGNKVYVFSSPNDVKLTFRVVVGDIKINEESHEEILVLNETISDEVVVNVKKHKDN